MVDHRNAKGLGPWPDAGNLLLRVGIGGMMTVHGGLKLAGGAPLWEKVGTGLLHTLGLSFWPVFWGLVVALLQTLGGALIALGLLTRPAALALTILMAIAAVMVFQKSGGNFSEWSHPGESAITCLAIFLMGTGRFALRRT